MASHEHPISQFLQPLKVPGVYFFFKSKLPNIKDIIFCVKIFVQILDLAVELLYTLLTMWFLMSNPLHILQIRKSLVPEDFKLQENGC